jgi:hypothetical protein
MKDMIYVKRIVPLNSSKLPRGSTPQHAHSFRSVSTAKNHNSPFFAFKYLLIRVFALYSRVPAKKMDSTKLHHPQEKTPDYQCFTAL